MADERYVKLYDDLSSGIITESKFRLLSGKIEERQAKANAEIEKLEKQIEGDVPCYPKRKFSRTDFQIYILANASKCINGGWSSFLILSANSIRV